MSTITDIITEVARSLGVPPDLAIATAQVESGLDPNAIGDQGTSFGLFQLHQGGELGSLSPQQAFDPRTNATVALTQFAQVEQQHPGADPGWIAAWAQRPADPAGYAAKVDAALAQVDAGGGTPGGAQTTGFSLPPLPDLPKAAGEAAGAIARSIAGALPGSPGQVAGGIAGGITGALLSVPTAIGHGLADATGAGIEDVKVWAQRNSVALAVALVVTYVLFVDVARGVQQPSS